MAVVKMARAMGRAVGRVLDEEDRLVLGKAAVLILGGGSVIVVLAFAVGLAIRAFQFAAG